MNALTNKVIWITGASSGIGEALVYECAKNGARVVLSSRREDELKKVQQQAKLSNENSLILAFDLQNTLTTNRYVDEIVEKFGSIDILINNGGLSQRSSVLDTSQEIEKKLFDINYFSAVNLSKAVLPIMIKQKCGKIVVVSSIAGKFGFYLRSTYSAAKHALHGYFESFRLENEQQGVSVLMVCPGKIKTNVSLNAITQNGGSHNVMDASHINSMSAQTCAEKIVKAILKNKEEVFIGGKELLIVKIKRFMPKLFSFLIRKQNPY